MTQDDREDPTPLKALVRRYFQRLLNEPDPSVCDETILPDYLDHDALPGTPPGTANTKRFGWP